MKKTLIILLIIIVAALAVFLVLNSSPEGNPDNTAEVNNDVGEVSDNEPTDVMVTFTDDGYAPEDIEVSVGDVVEWVNESSQDMWPASDLHPTHDSYPSEGGCIGSIFDACDEIAPGDSWRFKFSEEGEWVYHDHLAPINSGTVTVN